MEKQAQVEIRFIRLDDDVCEALNRISKDTNRRVSDIANEGLRKWLGEFGSSSAEPTGLT